MALSPELRELSRKHADKLMMDPLFAAKVKALYRVMRTIAPDRDPYAAKFEAYLLACVLEELNV